MQAIEGVELDELLKNALSTHVEYKKEQVLKHILKHIADLDSAKTGVEQAKANLKKAEEKVVKLEGFLTAVKDGRWEAIALGQQQNQQQEEKKEQ